MLDSTGKIPDGVLTDTTDLCSVFDRFVYRDLCSIIQNDTITEFINYPIPKGNAVTLGAFDECLSIEAIRNETDPFEWESFKGQHCAIHMINYGAPGEEEAVRSYHQALRKGHLGGIDPQMGILWGISDDIPLIVSNYI